MKFNVVLTVLTLVSVNSLQSSAFATPVAVEAVQISTVVHGCWASVANGARLDPAGGDPTPILSPPQFVEFPQSDNFLYAQRFENGCCRDDINAQFGYQINGVFTQALYADGEPIGCFHAPSADGPTPE